MKCVFGIIGALLISMAPAANAATQQTVVTHNGANFTVEYEPKTQFQLRQGGLGPRSKTVCHWEASTAIERTTRNANGQAIAALSRTLEAENSQRGQRFGYCSAITDSEKNKLANSNDRLEQFVASEAQSDTSRLHTEMTSLEQTPFAQ